MIRIIECVVTLTAGGREVCVFKIRDQARESLPGSLSLSGRERLELENGTEVNRIDENTFQITATGERLMRKL
jgi:hypothetical protein